MRLLIVASLALVTQGAFGSGLLSVPAEYFGITRNLRREILVVSEGYDFEDALFR